MRYHQTEYFVRTYYISQSTEDQKFYVYELDENGESWDVPGAEPFPTLDAATEYLELIPEMR